MLPLCNLESLSEVHAYNHKNGGQKMQLYLRTASDAAVIVVWEGRPQMNQMVWKKGSDYKWKKCEENGKDKWTLDAKMSCCSSVHNCHLYNNKIYCRCLSEFKHMLLKREIPVPLCFQKDITHSLNWFTKYSKLWKLENLFEDMFRNKIEFNDSNKASEKHRRISKKDI